MSDLDLHLVSVAQMLNLWAASGHQNYAKSGRFYLQIMMQLPHDYPWLYAKFQYEGVKQLGEVIKFGLVYQQN